MIILQAGLVDGRFLLWGEAPAEPGRGKTGARQQKSRGAHTAMMPYDAGAAALAQGLAEAGLEGGGIRSASGGCEEVLIWLPTVEGAPVASSPLIAPPASGAESMLAPWRVTALPLTWEQTVGLLCACAGKDTLAPGMIVGASLLFWATAMRFAGALVTRQQFLPDVEETADGWRARWKPMFLGADSEALAKLARAMPPACRALSREATEPPTTPAQTHLIAFVEGVCDYLVRSTESAEAGASADMYLPRRSGKSRVPVFDSLHDQWLYALRSPDGRMEGETAELAALAAQVREWRRPLSHTLTAPFRLCFRLEEPALLEDAVGTPLDGWYVRYLLQSVEDPSLLVPVEKVWEAKGRTAALLRRDHFEPRTYLLAALGQASLLSPQIEASLRTAAPGGYDLDTNGAQAFLTETAWMLEQAGFGVHLPAWWTRKGTKLRLTARASVKPPKMQSLAGLSMDTIVEFDWQVALGGEMLTREELQALAKQKVALVRLRGQWVQLDAREIEAALEFWKRQGARQASVREVMRMGLGASTAPGGLAVEGVEAPGWIGDLLARMQGREALEEIPLPGAFGGTLRPYQTRGYSWLHFLAKWGLGACLADDMGLGKTVQVLALVKRLRETGETRPVLVVCPTSVVGNWYREAQRFTPDLAVMTHHGLGRTRGEAFVEATSQQALVLSSFALLHRDFETLQKVGWGGIILDEAQNIKNPETKQSKAARALEADWRIALTGTPVENHVGDLWAILDFLNPGFLGSQAEFKRSFFVPIQANRDPEATERLKKLTQPFLLRRVKTDKAIIADLPEKMEMKVFCPLTKEQASLYEAVVKEAAEEIESSEGIQRRGLVLATLAKLKQVCNHPAQFLGDNSVIPGRSGKLARLTEMLEEVLAAGDKALIFSQFTEMGEIIRKHLQETYGKEVLFLHGGVPKKQRDAMVERFQAEGATTPFFLLSLKAGGVGLNLTAASHVFHFDRWWNPAVENQATDRAFRIGQKKNVQVHKFLCAGTLEEKIDALIESKREIAANVVGGGEAWLTELSTAELKELFALRRDAIAEAA